MEKTSAREGYKRDRIAWYSKNFNPIYQPLGSGLLDGNLVTDDRLLLTGFQKDDSNLTNYIDLRNYEQTHIEINAKDISGILDIDGFSNKHNLTFVNNGKEEISILYAGDSIIVDDKYTVRFWGSGNKPANASISISQDSLPSTRKGSPINYLSPTSVNVLNIYNQNEIKSFTNQKNGNILYTSNPKEVKHYYSDPINYQYNGVAFERLQTTDRNQIEIFKYVNKSDRMIRYGTSKEHKNLSKLGFIKNDNAAFLASHSNDKGLQPVLQYTHNENDHSFLTFEKDSKLLSIHHQPEWNNDGIVFYAMPSNSGFKSTTNYNSLAVNQVKQMNDLTVLNQAKDSTNPSDPLINDDLVHNESQLGGNSDTHPLPTLLPNSRDLGYSPNFNEPEWDYSII